MSFPHCVNGCAHAWQLLQRWLLKGSTKADLVPLTGAQGKYDNLTFWEQLDDGVQNTNTRKFLTIVPVALFLLATHGTDYRRQPLGLNLIVLLVLVIAKFPAMHKVRIFGINKY